MGAASSQSKYHTGRRITALLSIVVLAHNRASLTRACLESLSATAPDAEVVLADNASTDGTPALAREFAGRFRACLLHRLPHNQPYAVANNDAARSTTGRTLLFLNNDVIVSAGATARLVEAVGRHGGIAGARLVFPGGAHVQHAGMRQMLWGYASNLGTMARPDDPALNQEGAIFAVTGAMLAVDRRLFERVGGFDERYRWGYEDVDLCLRTHAAGAPVRYVPQSLAVHAESATLRSVRQLADLRHNYALYRRRWNHRLVPNERAAIGRLRAARIRRVVVFGTGLAAAGLHRVLAHHGLEVEAFTESAPHAATYLGRPVVALEALARRRFDRMLAGSQQYFALREQLRPFDPEGDPILPLADER